MRCIVCHGEDIQTSDVREELKFQDDIICVPIRVLVCRTCGERYYDRLTIRYLEEVEQEIKSGRANLKEVGKVLMLG